MGITFEKLMEKCPAPGLEHLYGLEVERVCFYRADRKITAEFSGKSVLSFADFQALRDWMSQACGCPADLSFKAKNCSLSMNELEKYLADFYAAQPELSVLSGSTIRYDEALKRILFQFDDQKKREKGESFAIEIQNYLAKIGLGDVTPEFEVFETAAPEIQTVIKPKEAEAPKPEEPKFKKRYKSAKRESWPLVQLKDITDPADDIKVVADVFAEDEVTTKRGTKIKNLSVYDGTDAIMVKVFEGRSFSAEDISALKKGKRYTIYGSVVMDSFSKDLTLNPVQMDEVEVKPVTDTAEEKRIEMHMHTNMSEMDGVCSAESVVKYVWGLGHEGVCITDHADVQGFVKAYNTAQSLKKGDPERPFKVGLGCEMNLANDRLTIVRNGTDKPLEDCTFICFDLETTGLSCYYDSIIEFGAVKIERDIITDRIQMFIKPPVPIPAVITRKTNITNEMVSNAPSFEEAIDRILEWIGDGVLVAHNATFDYYFLNEELRRIGRKPLTNAVIDTLDLSRTILKERRFYRLGNVANFYRITYDEDVAHRADYDAEVLSSVFQSLMKDAAKKGATTLNTLDDIQDEDAFKKVRHSHIIVLAKDQEGLRRLYEMVSESCTSSLVVMGKSGKEGSGAAAEPRIRRSSVDKDREHILIGSSCLNNEIFELACNGDDERLFNAMKWYDYIEIQPPGNYSTEVVLGSIPSMERLRDVLKRIIAMAKKAGKPVIADSDAHYCSPDQKIFRDVYIMSQGVGGVTHPLYIRDNELRIRTKNPDQHIRLTEEMKECFSFLENSSLVHEIVIDNPKKIFSMLEEVRPVPSGTFPPVIEGSDDKLREICHKTEHDLYEFEGKVPEIVSERLNQELDNIIRHGFGVHYYIAHLLVKRSNDDGYVVGSRGSVGSSFTATMSGITEVNPLPPHYLCPKCHYSEFVDPSVAASGFDLPDKECPHCKTIMRGNGHNIPFQTFLGFDADKTPDIDLNFSNEYQAKAHAFIKEVFGESHAYRAGTIGTVAEKTAYGYVSGYCEKMNIPNMRRVMKDYLAVHCQDVKRTTGQHPGGIIIIPEEYQAEDFTPIQYPANDPESEWKTTHYDFHDIHDNVLKFDILGHVDPTAMRLLQNISETRPTSIPMNDPETLSLFYSDEALHADPRIYKKETGALGLPEFGTRTTRRVLEETRPHVFSDLVIISGLSHGTDVWAGNAESLIQDGTCTLSEVIGCRDDIMTYLLAKNLEPLMSFKIMESVRKGKGLNEGWETAMKEHGVPDWYIDSCKKIKYMFPKAHAVAYVMMAVRIAWYKVHEPWNFYVQYLTLRCDAYEIETMTKGIEAVRDRMNDIQMRQQDRNTTNPVSNKEKSLFDTLEVCEELYARGFRIGNVDLYRSKARAFTCDPDDHHVIIPPFTVIDGLGGNVADSIEKARAQAEFLSKEDILKRTQLSDTLLKKLDQLGCLEGIQERNQLSLF
ncbi:MAG: PolC-type DNA polymerase III [Solobacterium sp.]|nr:PolC-type DNA polymerase III [Solobacterium sp.]